MAGMDHVEEIIGAYDESTKREVVGIICSAHVADGDHLQVRHKLGFRCPLPRWRTLRGIYQEKNRPRFTKVLVPRFLQMRGTRRHVFAQKKHCRRNIFVETPPFRRRLAFCLWILCGASFF